MIMEMRTPGKNGQDKINESLVDVRSEKSSLKAKKSEVHTAELQLY